jgi:hypothetical protein
MLSMAVNVSESVAAVSPEIHGGKFRRFWKKMPLFCTCKIPKQAGVSGLPLLPTQNVLVR